MFPFSIFASIATPSTRTPLLRLRTLSGRGSSVFALLLFAAPLTASAQVLPDFIPADQRQAILERVEARRTATVGASVDGLTDGASAEAMPVPYTTTILDQQGNSMDIVLISNQLWFQRNATATQFRNGDPIPQVQDSAAWADLIGPGQSVLEDGDRGVLDPPTQEDLDRVGLYYNFEAAIDPRGVCPEDYRVPSPIEWTQLAENLGGTYPAGGKMKSTSGWNYLGDGDGNGSNESGFTAYPTGFRYDDGDFFYYRLSAIYWSTETAGQDSARAYFISFFVPDLNPTDKPQGYGFPIRCMRNLDDPLLTSPFPSQTLDRSVTVMADVLDDGGLPIVERGVLLGTGPLVDFDNHVANAIDDQGGEGEFSVRINGLTPGTDYMIRAYAIRDVDTTYSTPMPVTTALTTTCVEEPGLLARDVDGNEYETVCIGRQQWFTSNLEVNRFRDGSNIPEAATDNTWDDLYRAVPKIEEPQRGRRMNSGDRLMIIDGQFYNFFAVDDARGLCPHGWHVPSVAEMDSLSTYLGGDLISGGKLKSVNEWRAPNVGATDEVGFNALPTGFIYSDGGFYDNFFIRGSTRYWASTRSEQYDISPGGRFVELSAENEELERGNNVAWAGFSVRCTRDEAMHYVYEAQQVERDAESIVVTSSHLDVEASGLKTAGFVWSSTRGPSLENHEGIVYADAITSTSFQATLTGFDSSSPLYVRSFVTSVKDESYQGPQTVFQPLEGLKASLSDAVADIDGVAETALFVEGFTEADSVNAYQFDITLPDGISFNSALTAGTLSDGASQDAGSPSSSGTLLTNIVKDGSGNSVLKVAYSTTGFLKADAGATPLVRLTFNVSPGVQDTLTPTSFLLNTTSVAYVTSGVVSGAISYGDVDGDGKVLAYDASLVLNYVVGVNLLKDIDPGEWESGRLAAADVDGVGGVMAMDASFILQHVVQLIDTWPAQSSKSKAPADGPAIRFGVTGDTLVVVAQQPGLLSFELSLPAVEGLAYEAATSDWEQAATAESLGEEGDLSIAMASPTPFGAGEVLRIPLRIEPGTSVRLIGAYASNQSRGEFEMTVTSSATGVSTESEWDSERPRKVDLLQNYPNPFNPTTQVRFALPEAASITLEVFDLMGRRVAVLAEGSWRAGLHSVTFDATGMANGVYVYRLTTPSLTLSRSMVLLK